MSCQPAPGQCPATELIDLRKACHLIRTDGLYSPVYDELVAAAGGRDLSEEEIMESLTRGPEAGRYLDRYRQINRESDISNIQLQELPVLETDTPRCRQVKEEINRNADRLRALEKYGAKAGESAYSIWIGSLAVFLIFMIHNYFGLFTDVYDRYPAVIFGAYLLVIVAAFWFYRKTMKNHETRHRQYVAIFLETGRYIRQGLQTDCFSVHDLYGQAADCNNDRKKQG